MSYSIFDLYSQPPSEQKQQHGPYEFLKPQCESAESVDSFRWEETPESSVKREKTVDCEEKITVPTLGDYKQFLRRVSNGTISVIRRKELPVGTAQQPQRELQRQSTLTLAPLEFKSRPIASRGYMENRKYWDNVNSMIEANRKPRPVLKKSESMVDGRVLVRSSTLAAMPGKMKKTRNAPPRASFVRTFTKNFETEYEKPKFAQSMNVSNLSCWSGAEIKQMEEWKSEIRSRAAALVYSVKGMPRPKRYMGVPPA